MAGLLLYYITDRSQFSDDEASRREQLLQRAASAADAGVDYIQLREKDLSGRELESLAGDLAQRLRGTSAKLLINSRVDVAVAVGAHGVHLPSGDISPKEARRVFRHAGIAAPVIGVSCHSLEEIRSAKGDGADFVVFGP
ncbi:MAG TPA: thiamine phosphate synthase, partial [Terriglobales bacterium]|nr:thiamine phosphate synthase [Terriglobales bacterium]